MRKVLYALCALMFIGGLVLARYANSPIAIILIVTGYLLPLYLSDRPARPH